MPPDIFWRQFLKEIHSLRLTPPFRMTQDNLVARMVVRGFLRDGHIVRVRFAEACARNAHERRLLVEFVEVCRTGVAHRGMDTANQLVNGMMFYGNRRRNNEGSPMGYLLVIIAAILSPLVAALAQMAVSRQREYLADASAVNITRYPEGMIDALKKLQSHSQPMKSQNIAAESMWINNPLKKGFFSNLLSSHPPIEKRIERLEHGKKNF